MLKCCQKQTEITVNPSVRMQPGGYNNTNLPKLQLPVFDGNLQQWQEFWDIYKATVHKQQTMPAVSKFNYLNRAC